MKRTIERHVGVHLLIPFVVTLVIWVASEAFAIRWKCQAWSLAQTLDKWPNLVWELVSIYLVFVIVIGLSIKKASDVRWTAVGHLQDILPNATKYFAIGTIPLREWFEPNSLVYLATILQRQMKTPKVNTEEQKFHHERVLLFYSEADLLALQASFLDEHYAKSLAAIHQRFDIPLAYLGPDRVREIINSLSEEHRAALGCYKPPRIWRKKASALRAKPELLPFAQIEENGGAKQFIQFLKNGNTLTLSEVDDPDKIAACKEFVRGIEKMIYDSHGHVKEEFKFSNFLYP